MTMGMLVAFQSLMNAFMNPVVRMVNLVSWFQEAMGDMNMLDDVLSYEQDPMYRQEVQKPSALAKKVQLAGELTLEKITFGYNTLDQPLIKEFSLVLTPGSRVALVGASGSGKSTIAKLVCGLFQPWEGKILFDSLDKKKIPRQIMLNSLSYVDQDIFLIQGSVRENLTMWNTAVPDHEMIRAARDACIHQEISARIKGYDSPVAEGGKNFSGGQRQQIGRAHV